MILTYTNPAYRMPTPNRATPPRSPKRKRNELHTALAAADDNETFPGSSPRMQVADQLQDLNIHQTTPARLPAYQRRPLQRKRFKQNPGLAAKATIPDPDLAGTPLAKYDLHDANEVEETPLCHQQRSPLSQSPLRSVEPIGATETSEVSPTAVSDRKPPALLASEQSYSSFDEDVEPTERSLSPLPMREDLTPDQAALTWQEDEITGHEIDVSSGDDGEGINGVGFRPTTAMAYARQQKRKQQVNEWKAREAREARQKRFDRRRGGRHVDVSSPAQGFDDDKAKRIVRFAEGL